MAWTSISQLQDVQGEDQKMAWQGIKKKEFAPGDKVLLFNSRVKLFGHKKLRSKWEGPCTVVNTSSHEAITLRTDEGTLFKVNGHRLKIFLEPKQSPEVVDEVDFYILL
jgi:hypothetical protein